MLDAEKESAVMLLMVYRPSFLDTLVDDAISPVAAELLHKLLPAHVAGNLHA